MLVNTFFIEKVLRLWYYVLINGENGEKHEKG